jgi:hypothetical protein
MLAARRAVHRGLVDLPSNQSTNFFSSSKRERGSRTRLFAKKIRSGPAKLVSGVIFSSSPVGAGPPSYGKNSSSTNTTPAPFQMRQ